MSLAPEPSSARSTSSSTSTPTAYFAFIGSLGRMAERPESMEDEIEPKLEGLDEDEEDGDILKTSPTNEVDLEPSSPDAPKMVGLNAKRPRGRPRKYPPPSAGQLSKTAKGRSKTGCITCRRRKKKCDETKPQCEFVLASTAWFAVQAREVFTSY